MTGPDHYREAEGLLEEAESRNEPDSRALWCLEMAKLHTALAEVAATALNSDGREWIEVAGPPCPCPRRDRAPGRHMDSPAGTEPADGAGGARQSARSLIRDRAGQFTEASGAVLASAGIEVLKSR
jgi:hypothetical protein